MKTVIFDLDGTIANTSIDVIAAFKQAFDSFNLKYPEFDHTVIGPPAVKIIQNLTNVNDDLAAKVLVAFREIHDNSALEFTQLMPNVQDVLETLKSSCCKICLATNKPRKGALNILKSFSLIDYFETISCLGDLGVCSKTDAIKSCMKYHDSKYYMVGDAMGDIVAANECGIFSIAYTKGFGKIEDIVQSNPTFVIDSLNEIPKIIFDAGI